MWDSDKKNTQHLCEPIKNQDKDAYGSYMKYSGEEIRCFFMFHFFIKFVYILALFELLH